MTDFAMVSGFEEIWRPVARARQVADVGVLTKVGRGGDAHLRLRRVVERAPEVMVKITGRTRGVAHLQAHLAYISREGGLPLEGRDGERLLGLGEIRELGADWASEDSRPRRDTPLSLSVVLSMPPGTSQVGVRNAARAFAAEAFGERFDYVFALHSDAQHPHVHLAVRMLGRDGDRLNPRKADLDSWRQTFARTLRDRGIAAEATPRRSRGVVRKPDTMAVRKLRERESGAGAPAPRVIHAAREEARKIAAGEIWVERPWESSIRARQRVIRRAYHDQARALETHGGESERLLAARLREFVAGMPSVTTRRNEYVRAAREALRAARETTVAPPSDERARKP